MSALFVYEKAKVSYDNSSNSFNRKGLKNMFRNGFTFAVIFLIISSLLKVLDVVSFTWSDVLGLTSIAFVFVMIMQYISSYFSLKKNEQS